MATQPMVTVKKADGTSVKMTLAELAEYKKTQGTPGAISAPPAPAAPPQPAMQDMAAEVPAEETPEPVSAPPAPVAPPEAVMESMSADMPAVEETPIALSAIDKAAIVASVQSEKKQEEPEMTMQDMEALSDLISSSASATALEEEPEDQLISIEDALKKIDSIPEKTAPKPAAILQAYEEKQTLPAVETPHALSTVTPVKDFFVAEAKAEDMQKQWDTEDHSSLLDTASKDAPVAGTAAAQAITNTHVVAVLEKMPGSIDPSMHDKLESLVRSHLSGVRSEEQLQEYLQKPIAEGGIGVSEKDIVMLLKVIHEVYQIHHEQMAALGATAPAMKAVMPPSMPHLPASQAEGAWMDTYKPTPKAPGKPVMHDVVSAQSVRRTTGPVQELAQFSPIDLHRLEDAGVSLKDDLMRQLDTLKSDAFTMYLDGRDAWFHSPLYALYTRTILTALNERKPLQDAVVQERRDDALTQDEITQIGVVSSILRF